MEMFLYAAIIISLSGLIFATYTDLKSRIVPNWLNFGLLAAGIVLFGVQSIVQQSPWPIALSLFGAAIGFGFAWILWKIGVFAGGDVKLFMGLGALNAFTPALLSGMFSSATVPLFPITLFMYSLVSFLPYGVGMALYKLFKNKPYQKKLAGEMKVRVIQWTHAAIFTASIYTILSYLGINAWFSIIILIAWGFAKKYKIYLTIISLVAGLILNWQNTLVSFLGIEIFVLVMYGSAKIMFSLRPLLSREVQINKLEEGMIPGYSLAWRGKKVVELEGMSIANIIKYAKIHRINELLSPQNVIVSATKARGLTDEEIAELKKLAKKGLIGKTIKIKDSMPFVPTMMLGYILCTIFGDILWKTILAGLI